MEKLSGKRDQGDRKLGMSLGCPAFVVSQGGSRKRLGGLRVGALQVVSEPCLAVGREPVVNDDRRSPRMVNP